MMSGRFFRIVASPALPAELSQNMPPVLWTFAPQSSEPAGAVALWGECFDSGEKLALASIDARGQLVVHFDVSGTIQGILREDYHQGFEPTAEMRLPFNYSRLPCWVKSLGRRLRSSSIAQPPEIPFPDLALPYIVSWLKRFSQLASSGAPDGKNVSAATATKWPAGNQAALVITHDVDTDWIFRHTSWLNRICQLEERFGLRGAWYCVPWNSRNRAGEAGMRALQERGCELGCHGYNHDAKFPLLTGKAFQKRMDYVKHFGDRWQMRGFRSEWLYRTPEFLTAIAAHFDYDSSVPAVNPLFSRRTFNGCGSCLPYQTHGGLWEIPLSVPMDEDRHLLGGDDSVFWSQLVERAEQVIDYGGLVVMTLHPQPHQMANERVFGQVEMVLERIATRSGLWLARPAEVIDWMQSASLRNGSHESL